MSDDVVAAPPGQGDEEPGDAERWAHAESILAGQPTDEAQRRIRRRRNGVLLIIAGVVVLGAVVGLLVALLDDGHHRTREVTGWTSVAGLVLTGAGLVVEIVAIVLVVRRGLWGQSWRSPLAVLSRRQRRALLQQIRGKRPVDLRRLELARYVAVRMEQWTRTTFLIFLGAGLVALGQLFTLRTVFQYWLAGYWFVALLLILVAGRRRAGEVRRFLREHPAPER